jgi:hypothetical protein
MPVIVHGADPVASVERCLACEAVVSKEKSLALSPLHLRSIANECSVNPGVVPVGTYVKSRIVAS